MRKDEFDEFEDWIMNLALDAETKISETSGGKHILEEISNTEEDICQLAKDYEQGLLLVEKYRDKWQLLYMRILHDILLK